MAKTIKLIDPTTLPKQTIDGKQALFAALPLSNPLMQQAKRACEIKDRDNEIMLEINRLQSEKRKLMLEIMGIKEDQRLEIDQQFATHKLPTNPETYARLIEEPADSGKFIGIAFFTERNETVKRKQNSVLERLEEMLDIE